MTNLDIFYKKTSHFKKRKERIKYIIIHCSAFCPDKMYDIFNELNLSTHYIIGRDGKIYELVNPKDVAFHAGKSSWKDDVLLNETSIGIELETLCLGYDKKDYTSKQINALILLLEFLVEKFDLSKFNILGHSDVSPDRKPDPGIYFPWKKLHKRGLGFWYDLRKTCDENDELILLKSIGYDTQNIDAARHAFCKHFMPNEIKALKKVDDILEYPYNKFNIKDMVKYRKILKSITKLLSDI